MLNVIRRLRPNQPQTQRPMLAPDRYKSDGSALEVFWSNVRTRRPSPVLEVGTRRSWEERSTHKKEEFPWVTDKDYVKLDVQDGLDVDFIGDLHSLPEAWTNRFECFIAEAVFEHLERPWIAAREAARILKPGAPFLVTTHQCYPIHGHPNDFFRFSKEALKLIFEDAGLTVDAVEYSDQCMIVPPEHIVPYEALDNWNREYPSYILVRAVGHHP